MSTEPPSSKRLKGSNPCQIIRVTGNSRSLVPGLSFTPTLARIEHCPYTNRSVKDDFFTHFTCELEEKLHVLCYWQCFHRERRYTAQLLLDCNLHSLEFNTRDVLFKISTTLNDIVHTSAPDHTWIHTVEGIAERADAFEDVKTCKNRELVRARAIDLISHLISQYDFFK